MSGETLEPLVYLTTKLRSLDGKLTVDQAKRLLSLPKELGFAGTQEFLAAFREAVRAEAETRQHRADDHSTRAAGGAGNPIRSDIESAGKDSNEDHSFSTGSYSAAEESQESTAAERSARSSADFEEEVRRLVEAGKTRTEISRLLGISATKVQSIKKALGLVKPRSKRGRTSGAHSQRSRSRKRKSS